MSKAEIIALGKSLGVDYSQTVSYDIPTSSLDQSKYKNGKLPDSILVKSSPPFRSMLLNFNLSEIKLELLKKSQKPAAEDGNEH